MRLDCCSFEYPSTGELLEIEAKEDPMVNPGTPRTWNGGLYRLVRVCVCYTVVERLVVGSSSRHFWCRLMNIRSQRQRALSIMSEVNKAYGLPNPSTWHERLNKVIKKATRKVNMMLKSREIETKRVNQFYFPEDRLSWPCYSIQPSKLKENLATKTVIRGPSYMDSMR